MIKNYENKKLKLNTPLAGMPAGAEVKIAVDKDGIPVDKYWRRRLADSKKDGCVELVEEKRKKSAKKEE